jgi:acylphosphatase
MVGTTRRNGFKQPGCPPTKHVENADMPDDDITSLRFRIEGFVQAVGYRNFAINEALRLGLDGWVRNRSDGTVEALVSGETKKVEEFAQACMRGPPGSRVKGVEMHNAEPPDEKGFRRRPAV